MLFAQFDSDFLDRTQPGARTDYSGQLRIVSFTRYLVSTGSHIQDRLFRDRPKMIEEEGKLHQLVGQRKRGR